MIDNLIILCYNVIVDIYKMSNLHFDVKEDQNMYERVGVIKEIDKLGRIVIPKEFRQRLGLDKEVEILVTKDGILLKNPEYVLVKAEKSNN